MAPKPPDHERELYIVRQMLTVYFANETTASFTYDAQDRMRLVPDDGRYIQIDTSEGARVMVNLAAVCYTRHTLTYVKKDLTA